MRVAFGLSQSVVESAEMIDLDHDHRYELAVARGTPPFALEELLKILLGVEARDGVDDCLVSQLALGERQLFGAVGEVPFERRLAAAPATGAENISSCHQQDREKRECIDHSPALFYDRLADFRSLWHN